MGHPTVMIVMEDIRIADSTTILLFRPVTCPLVIIATEIAPARLPETIVIILRSLPLALLVIMTIIGETLEGLLYRLLHLAMIARPITQTTITHLLEMLHTRRALIQALVFLLRLVTPTTEALTRDCLLLPTAIPILLVQGQDRRSVLPEVETITIVHPQGKSEWLEFTITYLTWIVSVGTLCHLRHARITGVEVPPLQGLQGTVIMEYLAIGMYWT